MSDNSGSELQATARRHLLVFGALAVCTVLVVSSAFLPIENRLVRSAVTLSIASVEAFLVAAFLMHLISERRFIFSVVALTVVLFVVLLGLPIFSEVDHIHRLFH